MIRFHAVQSGIAHNTLGRDMGIIRPPRGLRVGVAGADLKVTGYKPQHGRWF